MRVGVTSQSQFPSCNVHTWSWRSKFSSPSPRSNICWRAYAYWYGLANCSQLIDRRQLSSSGFQADSCVLPASHQRFQGDKAARVWSWPPTSRSPCLHGDVLSIKYMYYTLCMMMPQLEKVTTLDIACKRWWNSHYTYCTIFHINIGFNAPNEYMYLLPHSKPPYTSFLLCFLMTYPFQAHF
jgi:hypothetical protein